MRRTEAVGNDNNLYTEGSPSLGVPATVVGAIELNAIQEELALMVESAGLTVDQTGANFTQVEQAIKLFIESGGTTEGSSVIANNQTTTVNVGAIPAFDKSLVKSAVMLVDIHRRDDAQSTNELYDLCALYDPEGDVWSVAFTSKGDDAGIIFSITSGGQIQYTSSNYISTNYSGKFRVSHVKTIAITL